MTYRRFGLVGFFVLAASLWGASSGLAQQWPTKPGRIIVPFAAGGPMDIMARLAAQSLEKKLGQPFVIENRGGGGGTIGTRQGMAAEPDGYTLVWGTSGSIAAGPELYRAQKYDPSSLKPVALVAKLPHIMVVSKELPVTTLAELTDLLRKNPGKYNYAGSLGTAPHLMGALYKAQAKVDIDFVPYTGAAPAIADMLGGRTHILFDAITVLQPLIEGDKLRALATVDKQRWPGLKNVPTMPEAGFPDFTMLAFAGVFAPAGTPVGIVNRINAAINEGINTEEARATLNKLAAHPQMGTADDFAKFLQSETPRWQDLVRLSGAKAE